MNEKFTGARFFKTFKSMLADDDFRDRQIHAKQRKNMSRQKKSL